MENHSHPHNADDSEHRNSDPNDVVLLEPNWKQPFPNPSPQEAKTREKLRVLTQTLVPVPFRPAKVLDFARHETLLRRIGLWDFAHLEFDRDVRVDLVAKLIASYSPSLRCGYVNGARVLANRNQLARALKLPLREKGEVLEEGVLEGLDLAESVGFVLEFMWNWLVLHDDVPGGGADASVAMTGMPSEVVDCGRLISEGCLEKVDWVGLVWSMVERELRDPGLSRCYYASHLQLLIKVQHEELLKEVPVLEIEDEGEEVEEENGGGDVRIVGVDEVEEQNIELCLGNGIVGKRELQGEEVEVEKKFNFEQYKELSFGGNSNVDEPFLRQCDFDVSNLDCGCEKDEEEEGEEGQEQKEMEVDEEEEEDDEDDEYDDNHNPLEGMSSGSGDINHTMQAVQIPFSSGIDFGDDSVGGIISSHDDPHMISGPSFLGNGHKRDFGLDHHNPHHSLNGSNKRLRLDNPTDAEPFDFDICMDQIEHWTRQARLMYATKDRSCEESTLNQQLLLNELQSRDIMIENLHKARLDESQKGQQNVYRLEKELHMMSKLVEGYRKALKETHNAFAEYRARPQADEPYYKDVPGSGGLVLSVVELEKERLKRQEEERMKCLAIGKNLRDFEGGWIDKLEAHRKRIQSLANRLLCLEDQAKLLLERNVELKLSDPPEGAPPTKELTD